MGQARREIDIQDDQQITPQAEAITRRHSNIQLHRTADRQYVAAATRKGYAMKCCNCQGELSEAETYICERCSREIDRRADEAIGNQEEEDA
jgi:uncharacterized paraquat-inducible protein A